MTAAGAGLGNGTVRVVTVRRVCLILNLRNLFTKGVDLYGLYRNTTWNYVIEKYQQCFDWSVLHVFGLPRALTGMNSGRV